MNFTAKAYKERKKLKSTMSSAVSTQINNEAIDPFFSSINTVPDADA